MNEKPFSPNTRLWDIRHAKEFKSFCKYILCPRDFQVIMQVYRLKDLTLFYPLNPEDTALTLNEMRERVRKKETLFVPFEKKDTGIYQFLIGEDKPFVLILPGGGYSDVCSLVEGYSTAREFNRLGYNAFIGLYGVKKDALYPSPIEDVAKMLEYIFKNHEKLHVSIDNYALCGFSAGGHLAASFCVKDIGYDQYSLPRANTLMLAYGATSFLCDKKSLTAKNFLGKDWKNPILREKFSIEKRIDKDFPKTFLWQSKNDNVISIQNSVTLAESLKKNGCVYEYMQVEGKAHGLGSGKGSPAEGWIEKAIKLWEK